MTIFAHRAAETRDLSFIVDSWCDSYRTAYFAGLAPMGEYLFRGIDYGYRACMVAWVYGLLGRSQVLMAYRPGEVDPAHELAGYIVFEKDVAMAPKRARVAGRWVAEVGPRVPVVHYVYVKEIYRQSKKLGALEGVATGLFREAGIDLRSKFAFTAKTPLAAQLARSHAPLADCNPLLARFPKTNPEIPRGEST